VANSLLREIIGRKQEREKEIKNKINPHQYTFDKGLLTNECTVA
jgi:hypothetical protein